MPSTPKNSIRRAIAVGTALTVAAGAAAPIAGAAASQDPGSLSNKVTRNPGQISPVSVPGAHLHRGWTIKKNTKLIRYSVRANPNQPRDVSKQALLNLTAPKGYTINALGLSDHDNVGFATHDDYGSSSMRIAAYKAPKATSNDGYIYVFVKKA